MYFLLLFCFGLTLGEDSTSECQPKLAEFCFRNFNLSNLLCYDDKNCELHPDSVCNILKDRIECTQEIIDSDCNTKGRNNFDRWITALIAVHAFICNYDENKEMMMALITEEDNGKRCWDLELFLQCVEIKTRVTHIIDMLQVMIDNNECNWILIALSTCNVQAEKCKGRKDFLIEVFHIFIEQIKCTAYCSRSSSKFNKQTNQLIILLSLIWYFILF